MKAPFFFTVSLCSLVLGQFQAFSVLLESKTTEKGDPANSTVICNEHDYRPQGKNYCCNKCLAGYKKEADCLENGQTKCVACESGTYLSAPNASPECEACDECLPQNGQIETSSCEKSRNVQCGCPAGQYKSGKYPGDPNFVCEECSTCQNGTVSRPCSENEDTFCRCNRVFFFDQSERRCRQCAECNRPECEHDCPAALEIMKHQEDTKVLWIVVGVAAVVVALFAAGCIIQYFRNKEQSLSSPDITGDIEYSATLMNNNNKPDHLHVLPGITRWESDHSKVLAMPVEEMQRSSLPMPDITERTPRHHDPKVLYAIIEVVPVRHWREFARRLGLSDHIIDSSQEDYRFYKDSQYRVLHAWTVLEGSSMDQLYRVLREMNLGGCVEKIEERIEGQL